MASRLTAAALAFLSIFHLMLIAGQGKKAGPNTIRVKNTAATAGKPFYRIKRATGKIKLDGHLDEDAWKDALVVPVNNEFLPGENLHSEVKTECLIIYNEKSLYVGFRAQDPNPKLLRAHYSDRDPVPLDDNVGILLDTFNDRNRAFAFFCNPHGVQTDEILFDGGNREDMSWDAIWKSRGHINSEGYEVEIEIPFRALQFPRMNDGKEQTWGFAATRLYPRVNRTRISNFYYDRSNSCFVCQLPRLTGITGVTPGRNIELDPTITAYSTDERDQSTFPNGPLENNKKVELGLSGHWGLTTNLTLSAAINPDFSQVEADTAQLDINTQYALELEEKRPFFLEGRDFFTTDIAAFYSRSVGDPSWGVKVSGKEGKNAIGLFVGRDESTAFILPGADISDEYLLDQDATVSVLRYRRDIGSSSTIGILATDREGDGYYNRLGGIDGVIRFSASDTIWFQGLGSSTRYPGEVASYLQEEPENFNGYGAELSYQRQTRTYGWEVEYKDYSSGFRADLGFVPKVGYREGRVGANYIYWGKPNAFFTRIRTGITLSQAHYHKGGLQDRNADLSLYMEMPRQTELFINTGLRRKVFSGISFDQKYFDLFVRTKPTASLFASCRIFFGDDIDYFNARPGRYFYIKPGIIFDPGKHLLAEIIYIYSHLNLDEGKLFHAHIFQGRLVYHLSKRAFIRGIVQYKGNTYDPYLLGLPWPPEQKQLFGQFLFSYKLNPRTVLFLGYSDLGYGYTGIDVTKFQRTFFLKIGYALSL